MAPPYEKTSDKVCDELTNGFSLNTVVEPALKLHNCPITMHPHEISEQTNKFFKSRTKTLITDSIPVIVDEAMKKVLGASPPQPNNITNIMSPKSSVKTYSNPHRIKKSRVIETFCLPDTPLLPSWENEPDLEVFKPIKPDIEDQIEMNSKEDLYDSSAQNNVNEGPRKRHHLKLLSKRVSAGNIITSPENFSSDKRRSLRLNTSFQSSPEKDDTNVTELVNTALFEQEIERSITKTPMLKYETSKEELRKYHKKPQSKLEKFNGAEKRRRGRPKTSKHHDSKTSSSSPILKQSTAETHGEFLENPPRISVERSVQAVDKAKACNEIVFEEITDLEFQQHSYVEKSHRPSSYEKEWDSFSVETKISNKNGKKYYNPTGLKSTNLKEHAKNGLSLGTLKKNLAVKRPRGRPKKEMQITEKTLKVKNLGTERPNSELFQENTPEIQKRKTKNEIESINSITLETRNEIVSEELCEVKNAKGDSLKVAKLSENTSFQAQSNMKKKDEDLPVIFCADAQKCDVENGKNNVDFARTNGCHKRKTKNDTDRNATIVTNGNVPMLNGESEQLCHRKFINSNMKVTNNTSETNAGSRKEIDSKSTDTIINKEEKHDYKTTKVRRKIKIRMREKKERNLTNSENNSISIAETPLSKSEERIIDPEKTLNKTEEKSMDLSNGLIEAEQFKREKKCRKPRRKIFGRRRKSRGNARQHSLEIKAFVHRIINDDDETDEARENKNPPIETQETKEISEEIESEKNQSVPPLVEENLNSENERNTLCMETFLSAKKQIVESISSSETLLVVKTETDESNNFSPENFQTGEIASEISNRKFRSASVPRETPERVLSVEKSLTDPKKKPPRNSLSSFFNAFKVKRNLNYVQEDLDAIKLIKTESGHINSDTRNCLEEEESIGNDQQSRPRIRSISRKSRVDSVQREKTVRKRSRSLSCRKRIPCHVKLEPEIERDFEVGDIVWAKLGNFPFWPSIVVSDPENAQHKKYKLLRFVPYYHVRFFGDQGRRAWAPQVLPYENADDMEKITEKLQNKGEMSFNQLKEMYGIKPSYHKKWSAAVAEAEALKAKSIEEKLRFFNEILHVPPVRIEDVKPSVKTEVNEAETVVEEKQSEIAKPTRKRKNENTSPKTKKKRKIETVSASETFDLAGELAELEFSEISQGSTSLRTDPLPKAQKPPNAVKDEINLVSQLSDYKKNLFRGVTREKVCQICEKTGDVLKCRGQCHGDFHEKCADFSFEKTHNLTRADEQVQIITLGSLDDVKVTKSEETSAMPLDEQIDEKMKELMGNDEIVSYELNESYEEELENSDYNQSFFRHVTADDELFEVPKSERVKEAKKSIETYKCPYCVHSTTPPCLICGSLCSLNGNTKRQHCSILKCGRYYHLECLRSWPQTQWSFLLNGRNHGTRESETFTCPRHVCHTCASETFGSSSGRTSSDKLVKCLKCPTTYHNSHHCVPAGTQIVTSTQIICPRHNQKKKNSTCNTIWCFVCSRGGNLICCETCPTSVHAECLHINLNEDDLYTCEDCESGRFPLYGEVVWVKCGSFRWWPAVILFPNEIPENVEVKHHEKGEFVVRFYGTYDYFWVGRGRTFLYQEGDTGCMNSSKSKIDEAFNRALKEAAEAYRLNKESKVKRDMELSSGLKPPPYVKIKMNRPVGNVRSFEGNLSNATSCECDPLDENPCGPSSNCLNRLLLTECSPDLCPAGAKCNNQKFEKREYPRLIPCRTSWRGWGLKTLDALEKGQFVIEYVGEIIDEDEYRRRMTKMHQQKDENYYFLTIDKDRMLDAGPKGNVARFMNHSCNPNCETQKWTVNGDTRVGIFAIDDVPAETELTFNYNLECVGTEKKKCLCGAPNCSGFIGVKPDDQKSVLRRSHQKTKKSKKKFVKNSALKDKCFLCKEEGELKECSGNFCNRSYHLQCVSNDSPTEDLDANWFCPSHFCSKCLKRTARYCAKCTNSYCWKHSDRNIRYDDYYGFLCVEHDTVMTSTSNKNIVNESEVDGNESSNFSTLRSERYKRRCSSSGNPMNEDQSRKKSKNDTAI